MLAILLLLLFFLPPHIDIIVIARGRMVDSILENSTLLQTQVRGCPQLCQPFLPTQENILENQMNEYDIIIVITLSLL